MGDAILQFEPWQSAVDVGYWPELNRYKLDVIRLSEDPVLLKAFYAASSTADIPPRLQLDSNSFNADNPLQPGLFHVSGRCYVFNTLGGFQKFDRQNAASKVAENLWQSICSGAAEEDPSLLNTFVLLTFPDVKKFHFHYWFAFPALKPPEPFSATEPRSLLSALGDSDCQQVFAACGDWLAGDLQPGVPHRAGFRLLCHSPNGDWSTRPLSEWSEAQHEGGAVYLAVADPGSLATNPGWPLRNALLLAAVRWRVRSLAVVCLRRQRGRLDAQRSMLLRVSLPAVPEGWKQAPGECPDVVRGWEAGKSGRPGPRSVDLGPSLDPRRLAESAVDLNIRLMRWRAAPSLATDRLSSASCLLLGAGTLGCAVARTLLGWGVRRITFVDSGRVAFSNPVRQSLYEFADCLEGGRPKAQAAAEALQRTFPSVEAAGVQLEIPMPGHPLATAQVEQVQRDVAELERLVQGHDVVFLLMDTRESRWLPTLLAAAAGKLAINAALGFSSLLVMRHGAPPQAHDGDGPSARLGCYFCNDVVAPLDSTVDRTLDQQCTVARPGLAPMAGALAVELMAAVLQHPLGAAAPAATADPLQQGSGAGQLPLGPVPHMLRAELGGFSQMCLTGQAFRQCTACSPAVLAEYGRRGWPFLLEALQDPKRLEDLTGLTELHQSTAELVSAFDDDEEEEGDDAEANALDGPESDDWTAL